MRIGILLINVGSPEAPTAKALRPYLKQFLGDPRILDMPRFPRWLLLNTVILPFRPKHSAHAYSQIWTPEGSPLLVHTQKMVSKLSQNLGDNYRVEMAMGVGNPSISDTLAKMLEESLTELIVLPLFPQYASATSGSVIEALFHALSKLANIPPLRILGPFFQDPGFLEAMAESGTQILSSFRPDHILFSYHGLPERQILKAQTTPGHCLSPKDACCAQYGPQNTFCYRAQCFTTTRLLAEKLKLAPGMFSQSFQSRLGRISWIRPYTDEVLVSLAQKGKKRLAVFVPSFVADCLETLEGIGMRGKETFQKAGGEELQLIPCPNSSDTWISAMAKWVQMK